MDQHRPFDEPRKADYAFPQGLYTAEPKFHKPLMKLARQMTRRTMPRMTGPKDWKKKVKYY